MRGPLLAVHHLAVTVRDLPAGERFYGTTLGLPVKKRWFDASGALRSIWFELAGGAFLAVERAQESADHAAPIDTPTDAPTDAPGWHCIALGIAPTQREAWRAHLAQEGVPIERESDFTLYVRDPEHNLLGLSHYPTPHAR